MEEVRFLLNKLQQPGSGHYVDKTGNGNAPGNGIETEGCPLCHNRGLIISEDGDYAYPCRCMKQKSVINKFKSARLSKSMLGCTFEKFRFNYYDKNTYENNRGRSYYETADLALQTAKKFVAKAIEGTRSDGIMFTGNVGSGKSFLASCIANALLEHGREVIFLVVPDLLDEIRATYDSGTSQVTEQELVESARNVNYLILDDLGAHNYTDWTRNKLYSIINYRLNNQLPTVITTNLNLNELEQYLGDRTTSRIVQLCQVVQLLTDTDIRIQQRQLKDRSTTKNI